MIAIGLMSGTSCDGVDVSMIQTDGVQIEKFIANCLVPYDISFQKQLVHLMTHPNSNWLEIETKLTQYHAEGVRKIQEMTGAKADIIGFHGQSIFHAPDKGITWQIGNPNKLAQLTSIDVVSDFRRKDMAYGGQGAPLVPIFHKALALGRELPVAFVNIGGVANMTYIGKDDVLLGYDVGPGNALINDTMMKHYGKPYDEGGHIAKSGNVDNKFLNNVLADPFFSKAHPKSLDRNHFNNYLHLDSIERNEDKIATITAITVAGIVRSLSKEVLGREKPKEVYLCGGGAKNKAIVEWLKSEHVQVQESIGDSDYIEAQAFAYLAVRYLKNLPSSFPSTTGVNQATVSGVLFRA